MEILYNQVIVNRHGYSLGSFTKPEDAWKYAELLGKRLKTILTVVTRNKVKPNFKIMVKGLDNVKTPT